MRWAGPIQEDVSKDEFFSFPLLFLSLKQIASISTTQTHSLTGNWLGKNRCLKTGMYCLSLKDRGVCSRLWVWSGKGCFYAHQIGWDRILFLKKKVLDSKRDASQGHNRKADRNVKRREMRIQEYSHWLISNINLNLGREFPSVMPFHSGSSPFRKGVCGCGSLS